MTLKPTACKFARKLDFTFGGGGNNILYFFYSTFKTSTGKFGSTPIEITMSASVEPLKKPFFILNGRPVAFACVVEWHR